MENIEKFIQGSQKLTNIFGYWPDFHDAEILELHFLRGEVNADKGRFDFPVLTITIDLKRWRAPVQPDANVTLNLHVFATLRFCDVDNFRMEGFNYQNAILGLYIDRLERSEGETPYFTVHFDPAFGMGATFECLRIEVAAAEAQPIG